MKTLKNFWIHIEDTPHISQWIVNLQYHKKDYETNKFFNDVGLPIYNIYGMTEASGAIAMNYRENNRYDSVGKILEINQVKILNKGDI